MTARETLKSKFVEAGLDRVADRITELTRQCYRIGRAPATDGKISIGASRFGGSPDVPAGFSWPQVSNIRKPEPMEFVAQIRLADLPEPLPEPVPRNGLLSFFTRWSEGRVFHFPEGTLLQRTEVPSGAADRGSTSFWQNLRNGIKRKASPHSYRSNSLTFEVVLSPPDGNSSMVEELKLSEADRETYIELCEALWVSESEGATLKHQMFGHASPVQNEMELECEFLRLGQKTRWDLPRERFVSAAREWILLLQLDSDDAGTGPGWMWGDLGMVYFWIHRDDLAAADFSRAIAIEQCH